MSDCTPKQESGEGALSRSVSPRGHARWARALILCVLVLAACACRRNTQTEPEVIRAEFGVFFGGQIQERDRIPFEPNRAQQEQGFRLEFPRPLDEDKALVWELSRPGPARRGELPRPEDRVTQLGRATIPRGARDFEHRFAFGPGDPLGLWNVRVVLESQVVIDRPFTVMSPEAYREARRTPRKPDAGL